MSVKDDFLNEVKIGTQVELVVGPKNITGRVVLLGLDGVKIRKNDGRESNIALDAISYYEILGDNTANLLIPAVETKSDFKSYEEEFNKYFDEHKEIKNEINKIDNVYEDAVRNDVLQYKTGKITALLSELRENYCDVREIGLYVAYMYKRIGNYRQAISMYKYLNEEKNAKVCALEAGDENLYDSVDVFRKKENVKNAVKSSADFSALPTEHSHYPINGRFEGTLVSYTKGIGRGYIVGDDGSRYSYSIKNVKDKDLEFYLENTKEKNFNFKVEYKTYTNEYGTYPCVILLTDDSQREEIVNYQQGEIDVFSENCDKQVPLLGRKLRYPKIKNPREQGVKFALKGDFELAEPYLMDALQRGENIEATLGDLVTIWKKNGEIDKALQFVEYYAYAISYDKLLNLRMDIYAKGKRYKELLECIRKVLPGTLVTSKRIHLYGQMCRVLMELKEYKTAIKDISEYRALCVENNKEASVNVCDKMLAICYHELGDKEYAKILAEKLLMINENDAVARSIVSGTFSSESQDTLTDDWEDIDNLDFSDDWMFDGNKGLSRYVSKKIDEVNLDSWAQGKFKELISNGKVVGTLEQVKQEVENYIKYYIKKQSREARADSWAALAKVLLLALNGNEKEDKEIHNLICLCAAKSMVAYGDRIALGMSSTVELDTLRFLYVEAMNLVKDPKRSIEIYDKMVYTFYASLSALTAVVKNSTLLRSEYLREVKGEKCRSIRELFLTTFLLNEKYNDLTARFLKLVRKSSLYEQDELMGFGGLFESSEIFVVFDDDTFFQLWTRQKKKYIDWLNSIQEKLVKIRDAGSYISVMELKGELENIAKKNLLLDLDSKYFNELLDIVVQLNGALPIVEFDSKEIKMKSIVEKCKYLESEIEASPTDLSYEYVKDVVDVIQNYTLMKLDEVYATHEPVLSIEYRAGYFDVDKREVPFYFTLKNEDNKQNAEIINIEFLTEDENISKVENSEKKILRIRSENSEEGLWSIRVSEDYGLKYVEFKIVVHYSYFVSHENRVEKTIKVEVQMPLMDSGEFKEIMNPYSSIVNSNGVPKNMFFGRQNEVNDIVQSLSKDGKLMAGRGIIMYGQKRAGKSSILDNLQKYIENQYGRDAYIFVKVGSIGELNNHTIVGILGRMYSRLERSIRRNYSEIYKRMEEDNVVLPRAIEIEKLPSPADGYNEAMIDLFEKLDEYGSGNKYIPMFLIDEFTYIYKWINEEKETDIRYFPNFWKAFIQNNRVCSIAVGMDNALLFVNSPEYANDFACMKPWPVSYLSEEGARELICRPTQKEDETSYFNEDVVEIILRLTAGSACLIVILCDGLIKYMNKNKITIATKLVFVRFLKQFIKDQNWHLNFEFLFADPSVFGKEAAERRSLDNEKILAKIACNCNDKHELAENLIDVNGLGEESEEYRTLLLNELVRRDVLVRSVVDNRKVYRIKVDLVRNVLRAYNGKRLEDL